MTKRANKRARVVPRLTIEPLKAVPCPTCGDAVQGSTLMAVVPLRARITELEDHRVIWRRHATRRWDVICDAQMALFAGDVEAARAALARETERDVSSPPTANSSETPNGSAGTDTWTWRARAEKAEAERDAATNRLYAIVNTAGADCIRTYVGTEIADEIIEAERQRIDHYRDKAKKAEAEIERLRARTAVVWADDASPFDGAQVKALLDENERLRADVERLTSAPIRGEP